VVLPTRPAFAVWCWVYTLDVVVENQYWQQTLA